MAGNNTETKPFYHSRTILFNAAVAMFAVLSEHVGLLQAYVSDGLYLAIMMLFAAVNVYLRTVTTQGVGR
ncbi:MAG: hypothetical protein P1P78_11260 [Methyloprofundus sp.]|nr:hypothetical protein [Methyloprofundus sp.]